MNLQKIRCYIMYKEMFLISGKLCVCFCLFFVIVFNEAYLLQYIHVVSNLHLIRLQIDDWPLASLFLPFPVYPQTSYQHVSPLSSSVSQ